MESRKATLISSIRQGEAAGQGSDDALGLGDLGRVLRAREHDGDGLGDFLHFGLLHATGGHGRGADADTAGLERAAGLVRHGVLVRGDVGGVQGELGVLAGDFGVALTEIQQAEVVIGAAADEVEAELHELIGERLGIGDDLLGVVLELRRGALREADRLGGDDVLERAALGAGEDGRVDGLGVLGLAEDEAAARTAQGLVRGGGHEVGVRDGRRMHARGDEAGDVRDVGEQERAVFLGDLAEAGEVDLAGVGGRADGDHLGLLALGHLLDFVVVDAAVGAHAVVDDGVELAGEVRGVAVREVTAVRQVHRQDLVAGLDAGEVDGGVGLAAGVRLDVGVVGAEEGLGPVDGELFDLVDVLTTAVPALTGVTFGVLVREDAALGLHDGGEREVLGGDQLDVRLLALELGLDQAVDLGVQLGERDAANGGHVGKVKGQIVGGNVATANPPGLSTGGLHLVHAAGMPPGFEFGGEEGLDAHQGGREVDVFGPETKDISVVMAAAQG